MTRDLTATQLRDLTAGRPHLYDHAGRTLALFDAETLYATLADLAFTSIDVTHTPDTTTGEWVVTLAEYRLTGRGATLDDAVTQLVPQLRTHHATSTTDGDPNPVVRLLCQLGTDDQIADWLADLAHASKAVGDLLHNLHHPHDTPRTTARRPSRHLRLVDAP